MGIWISPIRKQVGVCFGVDHLGKLPNLGTSLHENSRDVYKLSNMNHGMGLTRDCGRPS